MPSNLCVRPLAAGDHSAWVDLWKAYLAFYETTLPEDVIDTAWTRLMSGESRDFQGRVAELDGVLVGLTHFTWHPHLWRPEGTVYLQDLYTTPQARGHGVGRALIDAVYAAADDRGAPSVYWLTHKTNTTARALYDRVADNSGFIKYARRIAA